MESKYKNISVLLIGPLPPPVGGTRISFKYLLDENEEFFNSLDSFKFINLSVNSNSRILNFKMQLEILIKILFSINKHEIISFHANSKRILIWGFLMKLFFSKKKFIFRFFGGDLLEYLNHNIYKVIARVTLSNSLVLIQTKGLKAKLSDKNFNKCKIHWFPTSRPLVSVNNIKVYSRKVKRFLFIGHVRPEKGICELLKSCDLLFSEGYNFEIQIAGRLFDNNIFKNYLDYKNIHYLGEVDNKKINELIMNCDIIIYPSYWTGEGYPGALIESINIGKPIITTNFNFLPELVSKNGILIKPNSTSAVYDAMKLVLTNKKKFNEINNSAKNMKASFDSSCWNKDNFQKIIKSI